MVLENKLNITDQVELARTEEKISKQKAKQLFDSNDIQHVESGTFKGLAYIQDYLFSDIYDFAGKIREVNISKEDFRFVPVMYLESALEKISRMPQSTVDEIIEKYVEMNIAHPFREGNGRATRIWLDVIFKTELEKVIDWNRIGKDTYLSAMKRSVVNALEIKAVLNQALTHDIDNRTLFMKGIDVSYFYEGYSEFKTDDV
tara:strand:- start:292 stop:897 length:606 start_codon:yes stop_codon:yes gene_type:complete